jgi:glycine hydroxymethyltransferase
MTMTATADSLPDVRSKGFFTASLRDADPEVFAAIEGELGRQRTRSN